MAGALRRLGGSLIDLGFDPRRLRGLVRTPRYLAQLSEFRRKGGEVSALAPILSDFAGEAGVARGHYFHQDLLAATFIHEARPVRHVDVGSRIDGFVAHVAAFREIEVLDIRPLTVSHPRIRMIQCDIMDPEIDITAMADSVSCLHALEHFGLGRYGDPIDPEGHRKGLRNLVRMTAPGGRLYLGAPIGRPGVYFNAHRVFAPDDLVRWLGEAFALERFDAVDDAGALHREARTEIAADWRYGCGIYTFRKADYP